MPNHNAAWSAAMIASFAFLVPGGVAFVYFGTNFYRYVQSTAYFSESFQNKNAFRKLANHATATRGAEMEALMAQDALLAEHQTDALSAVSGYSFRSAMDYSYH